MKTATLTAKVNRWLHEHLAIKTPAKLLGGLALGALLITAAVLPFGGLSDADEPARPLTSGQNPGYCEIDGRCYDPPLLGELPNLALIAGTPLASERFEEWPEAGFDSYTYHRFMSNQGKAASPLASEQSEYWPEVGLDSRTYHLFMLNQGKVAASSPLTTEQFEYWPEVGFDSFTYHRFMSNQGKVGRVLSGAKVYAEIDDVAAMVIYGYLASIFHALNQG